MSNPSLVATLGLNVENFRAGIAAGEKSLEALQNEAKQTAAAVALMERQFKATGGVEIGKDLDALRMKHRELQVEIRNTERQQKALAAVAPPAPAAMPETSRPYAQITRAGGADSGEAGEGGAHGGGRNAQLSHSARAFGDMLMAGQSPLMAAQMELPRIMQAFGGGLGPLLGVTAVALLASKFHETAEEAKKLREETQKIQADMGGTKGDRVESLEKGISAARANSEQMREKSTGFWNAVVQTFSGGTAGIREKDIIGAENLEKNLRERANTARGQDLSLERRGFEGGEESVAAEKLRREYEAKRKEVQTQSDPEQLRLLQEEFKLRGQMLAREQGGKTRALDLERDVLAIQIKGSDVASATAKARLDASQADLDAGPKSGLKHDEASLAVDAAKEQLRLAERATAELRHQQSGEEFLANMRGDADAKHLAALALERQHLEMIRKSANPDERREIDVNLDKNASATYDAQKAIVARQNQTYLTGAEATIQRGPAEQVRMIGERQKVLGFEMDANTKGRADDGTVQPKDRSLFNKQILEAHQLAMAKEDVLFNERQTLDSARAQTAEMGLQSTGHSEAARMVAIEASYAERIAVARRNGNTELVKQLSAQRNIALNQAKADTDPTFMTPGQMNANTLANQAAALRTKTEEQKAKRHAEAMDANERPLTIPDRTPDIRKGAESAGKSDGGGLDLTDTNSILDDILSALEDLSFKGE